jgi:type II secretory pathway predicted ATPase ExeA
MGRKKHQRTPEGVDSVPQSGAELQEPEFFDFSLLKQPIAVRQRYFEDDCIIEHPYLEKALDDILHAICSPGEELDLKRLGLMVLVIGPTRVGKTTLIKKLQEELHKRGEKRMLSDPDFIPFVIIDPPGTGRFDWIGYYKAVLRQLGDPFLDLRIPSLRTRDFLEAMIEGLIRRRPYAVIVDEAQHIANAASYRMRQEQLNQLKSIENRTGVSHVLVGTYEMRPFRKANAQLAGRSIDVHFPRYDASKPKEAAIFQSVLWALQRQLPVEKEPLLMEHHWEFLYARSIGCIGFLKMHLNLALERALFEGATTVTEDHLRATAPAEDRVNKWLREALEGEEELFEKEGADDRLLTSLGLRDERETKKAAETTTQASDDDSPSRPRRRNGKPGDRNPERDKTGEHMHEGDDALAGDADEEEAAG